MNGYSDDPVEVYLDALLVQLPGSPRQVRHTLAEVESHLRDLVARAEADGLDEHAAAVLAVERMGPVYGVVDTRGLRTWFTPARRRRAVLGTLLVGAAGGIAVGVAGLMAAGVRTIAGDKAIGIPFPTGAYTASDCARWLAAYPKASDCVAAMTIDHANDFLLSTTVAGFMGLVALATLALLRRRWSDGAVAAAFPASSEDIAGSLLALVAAVLLVGEGVDSALVVHGQGAGQWFCLAAAAAGAAAVLAVRANRKLNRPLVVHLGRG
jgi:MYXO-CTERM domain-containing protein